MGEWREKHPLFFRYSIAIYIYMCVCNSCMPVCVMQLFCHPKYSIFMWSFNDVAIGIYIYMPSNSQQETTNRVSHVTVVAGLLLTLDHYQPQISLKLHIKYCTLDDKIVAYLNYVYV